jgi:hypothetical protein
MAMVYHLLARSWVRGEHVQFTSRYERFCLGLPGVGRRWKERRVYLV